MLRFDHFRGFSAYWEVPSYEKTARKGKWTRGPGADFFDAIKKEFPELPFIAEDLGDIDEKVYALRDQYNLPGTVVLQFAFDDKMPFSIHIPHNHRLNCVVYTGTHDNNTIKGWYRDNRHPPFISRLRDYTGKKITVKNIAEVMIRLAYSSVARMCIIPMQDIMELGETARLNYPSTSSGNWTWQLEPGYENAALSAQLLDFTMFYGRI
jgi:4-alpha-glucanotransferase